MAEDGMQEYTNRVEDALAAKTPLTTYNRDIYHAFAIIHAVFRYAEHEVLLLSQKLERDFYCSPPMQDAIEDFLRKRNGHLHVLVEEDIGKHAMLGLAESLPEQVSIKRIPKGTEVNANFLVMDDCGFRFEDDRENKAGLAGFHNDEAKSFAARFRKVFDTLSSKAEDVTHASTAA